MVQGKAINALVTSRAMVRMDHWVALAGVDCVVFLIMVLTIAAGIESVRPGRGASFSNPSTPRSRNLSRHNAAIRGLIFNSSLICLCGLPPATQYGYATLPAWARCAHALAAPVDADSLGSER